MMSLELKGIVEGLLFACGDEGISNEEIAKLLEITPKTVEMLMNELTHDYEDVGRGMMIVNSADIFYLTTKPEHSAYYKQLLNEPRTNKMSQAMLETLAIIAYQQPVTRVEVEEVRGVSSDYVIQTLLARSFIEMIGRKDTVGRPILYGTTKAFLTYFGLTSLEELPDLPDDVDVDHVEKEVDLFFRSQDNE
jgi:segregation and condensation protein B